MDQNLKQIAQFHNRYVPPDVKLVERNGRIFFLHPQYRFDPIFTPTTLTMIAASGMAAGTAMSISQTLEQGKQEEKIGEARAAIDEANAKAAKEIATEEAKVKAEKGRRFIEEQKIGYAAGGVRLNVGAPLLLETQTRADIAKDVGWILERGEQEKLGFLQSAAYERAFGKMRRKQSKASAWSQGLMGAGSLAFMGMSAGMFSQPSSLSMSSKAAIGQSWLRTPTYF